MTTAMPLSEFPPDSDVSQGLPKSNIVVLNGFPGAGKFTILKRVKELLPAESTHLIDNHLLIDPVAAVIPDRCEEHHTLRRKVRAPIFEAIRKLALKGHVILMTACLAKANDTDAAFLQEHLSLVRGTDVPFFWINVRCDQVVLEQRLSSQKRCQGMKTKLTDMSVVCKLMDEYWLIEPQRSIEGMSNLVVETLNVSGKVGESVSRLMNITGLGPNGDQSQGWRRGGEAIIP